jgi:hypothetical protein
MHHPLQMRHEPFVVSQLFKTPLVNHAQQFDGTMLDFLEDSFVNAAKELHRVRVPRPPQVVGELSQGLERFG